MSPFRPFKASASSLGCPRGPEREPFGGTPSGGGGGGRRKIFSGPERIGELTQQPVFETRGAARYGRPIRSIRRSWTSACRKAGFPGRVPHDLRRSAVRTLERAGIPRSVAMKLTGHKTESVYRRYAIVSDKDLRDAGLKLSRTLQEITIATGATEGGGTRAATALRTGRSRRPRDFNPSRRVPCPLGES